MNVSKSLLLSVLLGGISAQAVIVNEFRLDSGTPVGNVLTVDALGLMDGGVTFDAMLTVTGFDQSGAPASNLNVTTNGVSVGDNPSTLLADGESLLFSMTILNEVGGTVSFDGFTALDFNSLGLGEVAILSIDDDLGTLVDNIGSFSNTSANQSIPTSPITFYAFADLDANNPTTYSIDDITGAFTGTAGPAAVPEPGTYAMLGVLLLGVCGVRKYRRRS